MDEQGDRHSLRDMYATLWQAVQRDATHSSLEMETMTSTAELEL